MRLLQLTSPIFIVIILIFFSVSAHALGPDEESSVDGLAFSDSAPLHLEVRADPPPGNETSAAVTTAFPPPVPIHPFRAHDDFVFYVIVGTTTGLGLIFIIICAICWFKYNAVAKQADDEFVEAEFSQHTNGHPGDGKLALSAQMYHYQHQKQLMMALEKSNGESKHGASDVDSDLENEDSDLTTVYECPGLAPTGEMEVRNPFFREEFDKNPAEQGHGQHSAAK